MYKMNREAMEIPAGRLLDALQQRIEWKKSVLADLDARYGKNRIWIGSYMENLALPGLFGFDMNDKYADGRLAVEIELRSRIFWLDNSPDDNYPGLDIGATTGMYYDITLFGQEIHHSPDGVPQFMPHPIADAPDLSLIPPFDFFTTGAMPGLHRMYAQLKAISQDEYGGQLSVGFPGFGRGPLDIYIQLRGYENFVADTMDRPDFVHEFLGRLVAERFRFRRERAAFLGEPLPATMSIDDDWVNIPFITPDMFRRFVLPAYLQISRNEGTATHFHTCGRMAPIANDLLTALPGLNRLGLSGWEDLERMDEIVDRSVTFDIAFVNTFVLTGSQQDHKDKLQRIRKVSKHRPVGSVCAQAIVKLHDDFEDDLRRVHDFIHLAREMLSN